MQLTNFAAKNINFLSELFEAGNLRLWDDLKLQHNFTNETYFQWLQLKQLFRTGERQLLNRILVMSATILSKTIIS